MASILFKWLLIGGMVLNPTVATYHPIFVSVTEIEHNAKDKTLEISTKIFTDDFEKTLHSTYKTYVDLLKPKDKNAMNKLVADYVQKHLLIKADGKAAVLQFLGYEQDEEGIVSFYQVNNIATVKKLEITDNILFEYKKEQISIIHTTVNGNKKSTKLVNPDEKVSFEF
jgi:U3 small nucleolar RNA-associated protein 14